MVDSLSLIFSKDTMGMWISLANDDTFEMEIMPYTILFDRSTISGEYV